VQAGDDLGTITWAGSDGTTLLFGAEIFAEVQTGVGNDDLPTDLIFKTNSGTTSTTERLRISSTGSMGLGVVPSAWSSTGDSRGFQVGTGACLFGRGSGDEDRGGIAVNYYNDGSGNKYIGNGNASRIYMNDGNIDFDYGATNSSGAGAALSLTTHMRIATDGDVAIGHYSPSAKLHIIDGAGTTVKLGNTTNASTADISYNWGGSFGLKCDPDDNAGGTKHIYMQVAGTTYFNLSDNGKITSIGTYNGTTTGGGAVYVESDGDLLRYTSSRKYKTDIETAEDKYADQILTTRPVWYRSTSDNDIKDAGKGKSDFGWFGFIAEEIAEINPRLVNYKTKESQQQSDGTLKSVELNPSAYEAESVRYTDFIPLMVNLLKRQSDKITALEADVASLKSS